MQANCGLRPIKQPADNVMNTTYFQLLPFTGFCINREFQGLEKDLEVRHLKREQQKTKNEAYRRG